MELSFYWHVMTDAWKLFKNYYGKAVGTTAETDEACEWWGNELIPEANAIDAKYNNPFCKKILLAVIDALAAEAKKNMTN